MPTTMKSFWDHPIQTLEEALQIRKQIVALQTRLGELLRGESALTVTIKPKGSQKRTFSTATLAKMRAAQQARWSKVKGKSRTPNKPTATTSKKKGRITPEGRARLAAAMKARWAAAKKKGTAPNVAPK